MAPRLTCLHKAKLSTSETLRLGGEGGSIPESMPRAIGEFAGVFEYRRRWAEILGALAKVEKLASKAALASMTAARGPG